MNGWWRGPSGERRGVLCRHLVSKWQPALAGDAPAPARGWYFPKPQQVKQTIYLKGLTLQNLKRNYGVFFLHAGPGGNPQVTVPLVRTRPTWGTAAGKEDS